MGGPVTPLKAVAETNLFDYILPFHTGILGFLTWTAATKGSKLQAVLLCVTYGTLNCAGWYFVMAQTKFVVSALGGLWDNRSSTTIIEILKELPYVLNNFRAMIILTILTTKRSLLLRIRTETDDLLRQCFCKQDVFARKTRRGRRIFLVLAAGIVLYSVVYSSVEQMTANENWFDKTDTLFFWTDEWVIAVFAVLGGDVPYFFSQQILVTLMACSWILYQCIREIRRDIEVLTKEVAALETWKPVQRTNLENRLIRVFSLHQTLLKVCGIVNEIFGTLMGVAYGLDMVTLLGVLCTIFIASPEPASADRSHAYLVYLICAVLGLVLNIVFFQLPHIALHEEVHPCSILIGRLNRNLGTTALYLSLFAAMDRNFAPSSDIVISVHKSYAELGSIAKVGSLFGKPRAQSMIFVHDIEC